MLECKILFNKIKIFIYKHKTMEEKYIITLSGSSIEPVEGTEELTTKEECETWLLENQEFTANEEGSELEYSGKYVMIPALVEE
jgi:hypothetical protein